jgi:hypothetical protein
MLDGRQPCRHPDVDDYGPAISVDAINTAGVSVGHLASFRVLSRRRISISAVHAALCAWFDSQQLYWETPWSGPLRVLAGAFRVHTASTNR